MSLSDAMTDAQVRKLKDASKKLKGRELKRVVERRNLLAELAMPKATKHGTAKKLTDRQAHAALLLDHDMMALWPTSGPLVMSYGEQRGGGDRKLNPVPKDYEAARRIEDLNRCCSSNSGSCSAPSSGITSSPKPRSPRCRSTPAMPTLSCTRRALRVKFARC